MNGFTLHASRITHHALLGLLSAVCGCTSTSSTLQPVGPGGMASNGAGVVIHKESELPKRPPKAETCVCNGNWQEDMADAPGRSALERDQMHHYACNLYQQAITIDPNYLPAFMALGRFYAKTGDNQHAVATYRKALATHPKDAAVWHELGRCYARLNDWDQASSQWRKAVELEPENHSYADNLGFALAMGGRHEEALTIFSKEVGAAKAHWQLAQVLHYQKQDELSKQHLQLALAAEPELTPARVLLESLVAKN